MTEVEIRFSAHGAGALVDLEHRLAGYGDAAEQMGQMFDRPAAWEGTLERFAKAVG